MKGAIMQPCNQNEGATPGKLPHFKRNHWPKIAVSSQDRSLDASPLPSDDPVDTSISIESVERHWPNQLNGSDWCEERESSIAKTPLTIT
jgi:hypothetical protein